MRRRADRRGEAGAVAMMFALLALTLMSVAALSVDLGNTWARGRTVQREADVTALAAGALLPMSITDARTDNEPADFGARAAEFLNQNLVAGQSTVAAGQLVDGSLANGEVQFFTDDGAACSDHCTRLTVTPPRAHVSFGLARALGRSGTDVSRSATVAVFSSLPPMQKVIPLWLPSGCGFGPVDGDTAQGPSAAPTPTPTPTATATATVTATATATASPSVTVPPTPQVDLSPVGSHTLGGTSPIAVTYGATTQVANYTINNLPPNVQKASIRLVSPDGSRYIEYAVSAAIPRGTMDVPAFQVGTEVSTTPGSWRAYAIIQENGANKPLEYSTNQLVVTVTGSAPTAATTSAAPTVTASPSASPSAVTTDVPVGCAGQDRGNFGQLYSPRVGNPPKNTALAENLAFGLDHLPIPFDATTYTIQKECAASNGNNSIAGAQLDTVSRAGNNCLIGDTGNNGPQLYDALIGTVDSRAGRLNVSGHTDRGTVAGCGRSNATVGSYTINNDVLSCFLRNHATLSTIASATGVDDSMLDPSIVDSPRFVWLPMVYATDRAQRGYQPIVDFVPAFITDETQVVDATAANGLSVNGNSVSRIRLFAFNKAALPPNESDPEVSYDTTIANPTVHLVG